MNRLIICSFSAPSTLRLYRFFFGNHLTYILIAMVCSQAEIVRQIISEAKRQSRWRHCSFSDKSWRQPSNQKHYSHDFSEQAGPVQLQHKQFAFHYKISQSDLYNYESINDASERNSDFDFDRSEAPKGYFLITTWFCNKLEWKCNLFGYHCG